MDPALQGLIAFLALLLPEHDFRMGVLGLRVRAPLASQGASLQEDGGPDTGAILNAVPLNAEYHSLCAVVRLDTWMKWAGHS